MVEGSLRAVMRLTGTCSWFGGPNDTGVAPDEGLAFIYEVSDAPDLFLSQQPPGTTGLARRLDPEVYYVACRWDYNQYPKRSLLEHMARVTSKKTGRSFMAAPADWGPNENTNRIADLSPGLMDALGITTDDEVEIIYPAEGSSTVGYKSLVVSAGHSARCRGASGIVDEYDENVRVVNALFTKLQERGVEVKKFIDTTSTTSSENLNKIVDFHNAQQRELDVSIHFNANVNTNNPVGTECLYVSQLELSAQIASAIAENGELIDRGPKERTDLFFLNKTDMPAILIEVCFVDSKADVEAYQNNFYEICDAVADTLAGSGSVPTPVPPDVPEVRITTTGAISLWVNDERILSGTEPNDPHKGFGRGGL